jgi:hypothetical protein
MGERGKRGNREDIKGVPLYLFPAQGTDEYGRIFGREEEWRRSGYLLF